MSQALWLKVRGQQEVMSPTKREPPLPPNREHWDLLQRQLEKSQPRWVLTDLHTKTPYVKMHS